MLPTALTIAGSDSGGGAGIQADLRTFAALGVFGTSVVTAVTAQNTCGVRSYAVMDPALVRAQIEAVCEDFPVAAVKTGMLGTAEIIATVAACLPPDATPLIIDPVMVAKGGASLLAPDAIETFRRDLLPRATLLTPNLPEAEALLGVTIRDLDDQRAAARALVALGARACLVKGGHARGEPIDVLYDGERLHELAAPRLHTRHTHGTGCTYAAAIAAELARGVVLHDAVARAHQYVHEAIAQAPGLGHGHGPLHHMHPWYGPRGTSS